MIKLQRGNILKAKVDALVNTVNCVGIMGRGIALQFKKAFPENYKAYESACKRGEVQPGVLLVYDLHRFEPPHYIINLPTKRHWRGKSRIEDIELGLKSLVSEVQRLELKSIALPPLGCGLGGLDWEVVRPRIVTAFDGLPDLEVLLFEPAGAPSSEESVDGEKRPGMTEGRAALLGLMRRYLSAVMDPSVSLLEVHKLMYFLQEAGQCLRLSFTEGRYGPYAENLRHVMTHINGHYITGYDDASDRPNKQIELKPQATEIAEEYLREHPKLQERFDRVVQLIDGFETPFGMELLATVHWVAKHGNTSTFEDIVTKTYAWGPRKKMFEERHIRVAWDVLRQRGWLNS